MNRRKHLQRGQATTEMIFILLGFAILLLGVIFTLSLEIFNTRVLMDSKYQTERSANFASPSVGGAGREIRGWSYANGLPFTLSDQPIYFSSGEIPEAWSKLGIPADSAGTNYDYEWKALRDFPRGDFKADYKESVQSAIAAANLITREGDPDGHRLTARLPELHTAFARLLKLRIDYDRLRNNPSNRVYLPANGEL